MYSAESHNSHSFTSQQIEPPPPESNSQFFSRLSPAEEFWRDRYYFLLSKGYELRRRYHPEWIPSWIQSGVLPRSFFTVEDACLLPLRGGNLIDAVHIPDGIPVYLKQIPADSNELRLMMDLSSHELRTNPRNHCVPLFDVLDDPGEHNSVFIVMPFLRPFDDPPFENVGEFLDFGEQILEGLVFLHEQGIAHRDCSYQNIRMDSAGMFPDGFHPVLSGFLPDLSGPSWPIPRSSTAGVKYYFTDFGISVDFPPHTHERLAVGGDGLDQEPPELHEDYPYDPFKLDIFIIGNLIRRRFLDVFSNLDFLSALIQSMTHDNPAARPDAHQVLEEWHAIQKRVNFISRKWRLKKKEDPLPVQLGMDVYGLIKTGLSGMSLRRYL